eukprot:GHUV01004666.1.p1 GENE.GHUV01004666.1~~GHUV01004666.1.p1  ORF type:complete len:513 (+),score=175.81 GHUV01004666.1:273-1811(+)
MGKSKKVVYKYQTEEDRAKESALEEFLFGGGPAVKKLLARPAADDDSDAEQFDIAELVKQAEAEATDDDDDDESDLFVEDRAGAFGAAVVGDDADGEQQDDADEDAAGPGPSSMRLQQQEAAGKGKKRGRAPVWEDPADADITVQVASAPRLRKLRQSKGQTDMTGAEYEAALRRQHCVLHSRTSWALSNRQQQQKGKGTGAVGDINEQEEPDEATAERLLRSGGNMLLSSAGGAASAGGLLAPGSIELSRLRDANGASPSDAVVQSVQFHPNGQLMLTAGFDKRLRLFQVDGLRNPLVQSLFLQDCPIHSAAFAAGGNAVVAAGRRPFYYIADLHNSKLERVTAPPSLYHQSSRPPAGSGASKSSRNGSKGNKQRAGAGSAAGMKSCESFAASPDPHKPLLAFLGDGGHIGLVSLGSRSAVGSLKMNGSARAAVFTSDGSCLITAGGVWGLCCTVAAVCGVLGSRMQSAQCEYVGSSSGPLIPVRVIEPAHHWHGNDLRCFPFIAYVCVTA